MGILKRGGTVRTRVVGNRKKDLLQGYRPRTRRTLSGDFHGCSEIVGRAGSRLTSISSWITQLSTRLVGSNERHGEFQRRAVPSIPDVDEQAFRYNNRKPMDDGHRFSYVMRKIVGKRLTYTELTGNA